MLTITIPGIEAWDERTERFVNTQPFTLVLQHSLVSLSKWEARYKKPFLSNEKKTADETYGYIQAMSESPVDVDTIRLLSEDVIQEINDYIENSQTATWFTERPGARRSREVITNEIIYDWMDSLQIPWEAQHWHLNRLFTLIKVASEKNQPKKKMGRAEQLAQQRRLNAERLQKMNTAG